MSIQRIPMTDVPVSIYTKDFLIKGTVFLPEGGRVSDFINMDKRFFHVADAVVYPLADDKEIQKTKTLIVNQNEIMILVPEEEHRKDMKENAPYIIAKDKVQARFYVKDFIIDGTAYLPKSGGLSDYINVNRKFLPITEASLYSLDSGQKIAEMSFLALNRAALIFLLVKKGEGQFIQEDTNEKDF